MKGNKIMWALRNPFLVVHSMVHNWEDFGLNELFEACSVHLLNEKEKRFYKWLGVWHSEIKTGMPILSYPIIERSAKCLI